MSDYILSCSSTVDLTPQQMKERNLRYVCFHFILDGQDHKDDMGQSIAPEELYSRMVAGAEAKTSQVALGEYTEYFEAWLVKGGRIIFDSKHKEKFDDEWSPIPEYVILDFKDRILSVQNPCVTYYASVYWIPAGTEEFKDIQNWKAITTLPSNELPAAFEYKKDISKYHICDRHYTWDYKNNIIPYLEKKPNKNCLQSNS